jgi:hypothetical protein
VPAAFRRPLVCPVLIGRDAEVRSLRHAIERTIGGRGETVLLSGDAGIGKSRLTGEARSFAAARGMVVLDGSCFPQDRTCPYALMVDILRTHLAGRPPDEIAALLGPFSHDLRPLLPDIVPPAINACSAGLRDRVILAGDAEYYAARRVHNGVYDRRPALVVRAADETDLIAAVTVAREHDLPLAVRSGGHSMGDAGAACSLHSAGMARQADCRAGGLLRRRPGDRRAGSRAGAVVGGAGS